MIYRVDKAHSKDEVLGLMEPLIADWFNSKFKALTEPQSYAVPLIHEKKNVIVSSPTGSGKTLTAFLSIINELLKLAKKGKLEDKIYCVYISPLKALANDINKNLISPLKEMKELAQRSGYEEPEIRTAIRHGDTSAYERQRMAQKPPHIFITTPETLSIVLSTPKFRQKFNDVKYAIVDEIHEICSNKRGAHLSLTLERLQQWVENEFVRIGLSATIAPVDEVAKFLVGYENGKLRDVHVIEVEGTKRLDIKVLCPVNDILALPSEIVNSKMYELLKNLMEESRTTLVFTNTRSGTENVVYKLKERGMEGIEAHHGSLSKVIRHDVEDRLKNGDLKGVISSTSLELGIDIGYIDLVCQIGSPKSIAKGVQRIGRAGHAYGDVSKGRVIVFDNDDLIECATLTNNAYSNKIDRVDMPSNCLDVLAQNLIGMSLEKKWDADEAYELVKRSYSFKDLPKQEFVGVLDYLSSREPEHRIYSKIWFDKDENVFGRKRGSRLIYYTNVGTIPEEGSYTVVSDRGVTVGELSEKFVEHLSSSDVFVLGGKPYQFERVRGMRVYVRSAEGHRPTVPSWVGEMLPRSFDLAIEVGKFRGLVVDRLKSGKEETKEWLMKDYRVDEGSANSIINYLNEQQAVNPFMPTDKSFLIEGYKDLKGNRNLIFHYCLGRRVNDALSRAYAYAISKELKCNVKVSVTDDNFMLTFPKKIEVQKVPGLVSSAKLEESLKSAIKNSELFKQRFRHCATRSFMILRNYKGHEVSVGRQQLRSFKVLDYLHRLENFPIIKETYNEILSDVMDVHHAKVVLQDIEEGKIKVHTSEYSNLPSPLAHNVVLLGISDMVLMEDRSALLRELHRRVLRRILPDVKLKLNVESSTIKEYYDKKFRKVKDKEDLKALLGMIGPMNVLQTKGTSISKFSSLNPEELETMVRELVEAGEVQSLHTPTGILWALREDIGTYSSIYARDVVLDSQEQSVLNALGSGPKSTKALSRELEIDSKDLLRILKKLEWTCEVHRVVRSKDEVIWSYRKVHKEQLGKSMRRAILQRLELGPQTIQELSYHLGVDVKEIEPILKTLESSDRLAKGNFYAEEHEQYMLSKDFVKLSSKKEKETLGELINESKIASYIYNKQFNIVDLERYFDLFMDAAMPFDVFNHTKNFSFQKWQSLLKSAEILQGRFIGGKVRFVRSDYGELLASAYRTETLSKFDKKVLAEIKKGNGSSFNDLVKKLGEDRDRVRESVEHLDNNLYIIRKYNGISTTQNIYLPFELKHEVDNYFDGILLRHLKGYGPASLTNIQRYTHFGYDDLESKLNEFEKECKVARIRTENGEEYYILTEELGALRNLKERKALPLRILSMFDPYVQPLWSEIYSRYGDRWVFPIVKGMDLKGMVEKWEMSGCIEVREIDVEETLLDEVLKELDRVMKYNGLKGTEIIRIRRALGRNIDELDERIMNVFKNNGYFQLNNYLVKGNVSKKTFEKSDILAYVFWKQGLGLDRYSNVLELVKSQGSVRTPRATKIRVRKTDSLDILTKRGDLVKAHCIPDYFSYTTPFLAEIYRKAKSYKLKEYDKIILKTVEEEEPIGRNKLIRVSPLGYGNTIETTGRLFNRCHLAKNNKNEYVTVRSISMTREEARKKVIKELFKNFGIFSAENLGLYTKFEYKMRELRALLKELEEENFLVKGYFVKGDTTLYWMLKNELDKIGNLKFNRNLILSPDDNLWQYLQLDIRNIWGMGACHVVLEGTKMTAAFKAKVRKGELTITKFKGTSSAWKHIKAFAASNLLAPKEEFEKVEDWEVMMLYEKTKGKALLE